MRSEIENSNVADGSTLPLRSSIAVTAIAAIPGPVTGMTVATKGVIDQLRLDGEVQLFNLAPRERIAGWKWKVYKFWRVLQVSNWLKQHPASKGAYLYLPANANRGLVATERQVRLGKSLGYRVALHHHVFSYLSTYDERMNRIQQLMDADDVNIILSREMEAAFASLYNGRANSLEVNYAFMMRDLVAKPIAPRACVKVVGHLSNLTSAKGFDVVLETFAALRDRGEDVRLAIAGPLVTGKERLLLEAAQRQYPDLIEYRGPVFGVAKEQFLNDIDLFLMPTRYVNEAQPLVILEAFSRGKPVIAYGRGCIPSLFVGDEGVAVDPQAEFKVVAMDAIQRWMRSSESYERAQLAARARLEALLVESLEALNELSHRLHGTTPTQGIESSK